MSSPPAPFHTAANCNLWSGAIHIFVGLIYVVMWIGLWSTGVGLALGLVGVAQMVVAQRMRAGIRHPLSRASLLVGIAASVLSLNPLNGVIAGFGYLQIVHPDVATWLDE